MIRRIKLQALCLLVAISFACDQKQITDFSGASRSNNDLEKRFIFNDLEMSDRLTGVRVLAQRAAMDSSGELSIRGVQVESLQKKPKLLKDKTLNRLEINFEDGTWNLSSNKLLIKQKLRFVSKKGKTELEGLTIELDPFKQMILCSNDCRLIGESFQLKSKEFEMSFKDEPAITAFEVVGEFNFDKE